MLRPRPRCSGAMRVRVRVEGKGEGEGEGEGEGAGRLLRRDEEAVERAGGRVAVDEARLLAVLHRGEPRGRAALSVARRALVEVEEDVPLLLELRELHEDLQQGALALLQVAASRRCELEHTEQVLDPLKRLLLRAAMGIASLRLRDPLADEAVHRGGAGCRDERRCLEQGRQRRNLGRRS